MAASGGSELRDLRRSGGERGRRRDWAPAYRRQGVHRLPWWIAGNLNRFSVALVVSLMLGILGATLWFGAGRLNTSGDGDEDVYAGPDFAASPAADLSKAYEGELDPRFGADIPPVLSQEWSRYGYPLHYGPRGAPLVEDLDTGEVRELTEFELEFPAEREFVRDPRDPEVAMAPGPDGQRVRWRASGGFNEELSATPRDRIGWFETHERGLNAAVADLEVALDYVYSVDYEDWDARWGRELSVIINRLHREHAGGSREHWRIRPLLDYCNTNLELAYRGGITEGCPSEEYQAAVALVWHGLGDVVEALETLGRSSFLGSDTYYRGTFTEYDLTSYRAERLLVLRESLETVEARVDALAYYGAREGYYVRVHLP